MVGILMLSCGHSDCDNNGGMCSLIWCKLPEELRIEVLCRLPDKPLIQFKCVSKALNFFIANICIPRLAASAPLSGFIFRTIDFRAGNGFLTLDGHYDPESLNSHVQTSMHLFTTMHGGLVGCFNGLFLLSHNFNGSYIRYFVHNPATKQCVSIPVNPMHKKEEFVGMAFDPMHPRPNNSYKIVRIYQSSNKAAVLPDFDVFSSLTGEWSSLRIQLDPQIIGSKWVSRSAYLKGKFYVLSFSGHLLRFDLHATDDSKLSANAIELPVKATRDCGLGSISISNESLYYSNDDKTTFSIWLLEASALIPKYNISINKLRQLPYGEHLSPSFIPFVVDPASSVIYVGNVNGKVVLKYDLQTNKLELFHQLMDTRIVHGRSCFYPFRRCLVRLSEFTDKCIVW